jgi:toxin ParE1/3/4
MRSFAGFQNGDRDKVGRVGDSGTRGSCGVIAKDSVVYAAALLAGAEKAAESLTRFPRRGRTVPEYGDPDIREIFVGSDRLIFRISETQVRIVAFVHGARDLEKLIQETE